MDDADKPDDLNESDNSDDSDDSLMTSWAFCPSRKKWSWPQFPRPGQWPKSGQFLLTAYCKMAIFRPLAARSPQRSPGQARRNKVLADSADDPDDADKADDLDESDILAEPQDIRYWLIVLMIQMMQINPMVLMSRANRLCRSCQLF